MNKHQDESRGLVWGRLAGWRRTILSLIAAVGIGMSAGGCTTNPATGQMQLNAMSTSQEIAMGEEAAPQFLESYGGEIPDAQITQYVRTLGQSLAAQSERPELPWEFFAIDSSVINAFALPGGKVFISRGLMQEMTSEAQLSGVLGHEIGHVTAQHIGQQITQATALQTALQVGLSVAGGGSGESSVMMQALGVGAQLGGSAYLLSFGRSQEIQADSLGIRYMAKLGYNPWAQVEVMQILDSAAGRGGAPEWMSTHPYPSTRIEKLTAEIQELYPSAQPGVDGVFQNHRDRFQQQVLSRLASLPPAKHTGEEQPQQ